MAAACSATRPAQYALVRCRAYCAATWAASLATWSASCLRGASSELRNEQRVGTLALGVDALGGLRRPLTCAPCMQAVVNALRRWQTSFGRSSRAVISDPYVRLILDRCLPPYIEKSMCTEPLDRLLQEVIAVRTSVIGEQPGWQPGALGDSSTGDRLMHGKEVQPSCVQLVRALEVDPSCPGHRGWWRGRWAPAPGSTHSHPGGRAPCHPPPPSHSSPFN